MAHSQWKSLLNFTTRKHLLVLIFSACMAILAGAITPTQSYLLGRAFGTLTQFTAGTVPKDEFNHDMLVYTLYFVGVGTASWILTTLFFATWTLFGDLQARSARERLFKALLDREIEWFDRRKDGVGGMTTQIQSIIADLQDATGPPLGLTIRDITTALASLGLALHQSWKLTLVVTSTLPLIMLLVPLISRKVQCSINMQTDILSAAAKHVTNTFASIETVKCFNGQAVEKWRYAALLRAAERCYFRQVNWSALQIAILRVIALSMFVQGFWYGSTLVEDAGDTGIAGSILTAFWSCIAATSALMQIVPTLSSLEKGKVAGDRLRLLMAETAAKIPESRTNQRVILRTIGDITFKNVQFTYPSCPHQPVLQGIDLFFPSGELIFVIGKSGSGKSTIGQLLMQFYSPCSGTITLDNTPLDTVDANWLRSKVLLVEQRSALFNTTLHENIALGSTTHSTTSCEDVKDAAKFAMIHDAIEKMSQSFQTGISTEGRGLSTGQEQRVALARAKIRDPAVLILDEATSALDYVNRTTVIEQIRKWRKGRSTIIITHDISQILPGDFAYIMKDGLVVQSGFRSAMEKLKGSPFQDLIHTPKKPSRKSGSILSEMVRPAPPRYAVLDSDVSDAESEALDVENPAKPHIAKRSSSLRPRTPLSIRRTMWGTPILSSHSVEPDRQSMIGSQLAAQCWSDMLNKRIGNTLGNNPIVSSSPKFRNSFAFIERNGRGGSPLIQQTQSQDDLCITTLEAKSRFSNQADQQISQRPVNGTEMCSLKTILSTVWPNLDTWWRFQLPIGIITTIAFAISTPLFAFVFSRLLNALFDPVDRRVNAKKYSLAILGIAFCDAITVFISVASNQCLAQSWVTMLRKKATAALLEQPREFFDHIENAPSKIAECLDQHAEVAQHVVGRFVVSILKVAVMVAVTIIWSFISCWKLTLVLLATTPILLLITRGLSSVSAVMEKHKQEAVERASAVFYETFTNIKTVRILTLESHFSKKHAAIIRTAMRQGMKEGIYVGILFGLSQSVFHYIIGFILWYASVLIRQDEYGLDTILQVLTLLIMSISTATMILASVPQLSASRESTLRLLRLCKDPEETYENKGKTQIASVGDIVFSKVQFHYPSRPKDVVLKDVSLRISAGTCVAIVGPSGSGKSTIASILLKLYETDTGKMSASTRDVTVSNLSLQQISTARLRDLVSFVSQNTALFPTTISGNIVYGLRGSDSRNNAMNVKAAATCAGIDDFITSLPDGYDTVIGDGGMSVSGGQAQRIAIARALARDPEVLILDEPTSSLDAENAGIIRQTILRLLAERATTRLKPLTVIIITHDKEMMEIADRIVMVDKGTVVEEGPYHQLIRQDRHFARLLKGEAWDKDVGR